MFTKSIIYSAAILLFTLLLSVLPATATQPFTQIDIIFDASGSMWGQIDGKAKIEIAKAAVNDVIDDLAKQKNLEVALRVYGHLNKKCTNSILESPMGPVNATAMKSLINGIKPKGKTPISFSLEKAVNDFKKEIQGDKVIVLITDGIESCNGDPCTTAKILKEQGIVTRLHIVGFDMGPKKLAALKCIAKPSGGMVIGAENAKDLIGAMNKIVKSTLMVNLEIFARDGNKKHLYADYEIYKSGTQNRVTKGDNAMDRKAALCLNPGNYDIKVTNNQTGAEIWFRNVPVTETNKTIKTAVFAERKITIKIKNASGNYLYGDVYIYDKAGNEIKYADTSMGNQASFTVLPGIYDIKSFDYETRKETWLRDIDLTEKESYHGEIIVE